MTRARRCAYPILVVLLTLLTACESTGPSLRALTITDTEVPNAVLGVPYARQLTAHGGDQPYTWTIMAGSLPPGLDLNEGTGLISGTPPVLTDNDFTVQVTSTDGQTATKALEIGVFTPLAVSTTSLPDGIPGLPYDATLTATGGDGNNSWTLVAGTLQAGLTLASGTGTISGTPTATGSPRLRFRVTSGDGQTAEASLTLRVEVHVLTPDESCSDYTPESIVTFEDGNLVAALRVELGIGAGISLTCEDLAGASWIDLGQTGIVTLPGIQNLVAVDHLWLGRNSISDVSLLQELHSLVWLDLGSNDIIDITPLSGLTSLEFLEISYNAITDLTPLSGLTGLTRLAAAGNSISDVTPLSGLTALEQLVLGSNQISDVSPLAGMTSMTYLLLSYNSISDITPLAALTALTYLGLAEDPIGDLSTVGGFTALESLNLSNMGITDAGFLSPLTSLVSLAINHNQIADLSSLSGMSQLMQLFAHGNAITDIGPLGGLTSLSELWLASNMITDIGALQGLTALQQLYLGQNAGLSDIQPLLNNPGMGTGDYVTLDATAVACPDVNALTALGVTVVSDCP